MTNWDDKVSRLSSLTLALLLIATSFFIYKGSTKANENSLPPVIVEPEEIVPAPIREEIMREQVELEKPAETFSMPTHEFAERITKKSFGIFVSPQNSPIQPERYTGFHTAVDIEYGDVSGDVPVFAVANGKVVYSNIVNGYGGVFIIEFDYNGAKHNAIYGHIRSSSLPSAGRVVLKGEQIGLLGTGFSAETDGERKHLHFGILSNSRIDLRGYVTTQSQLSGWLDPLLLYP